MTDETGERIRAARSARGLSQADLAAAVGVSNSYLSHIEAGRRPVSTTIRAQIARALGVDIKQLEQGVPSDRKEALQLKLRFAELALHNGSWALAVEEFTAAIETAKALPLERYVDEATWGRARATEAIGQLEAAIEDYEWLLARSTLGAAVPRESVSIALVRAYSECGDLGRAIDVGERALEQLHLKEGSADAAVEVELTSTLAGCYVERGDLTRAQQLIGRALQHAEREGSPRARAAAAWNAAVIADSRYDVAAARVHADRALALYEEIDNARAVGLVRVVSAGLLLRQEYPDPQQALPQLDRALAELAEVGTELDIAYAHTEQARAFLFAHDPQLARETAQAALENLPDGDRLQRGRVLLVIGHAAESLGQHDDALAALRSASEHLRAAGASRQAAVAWRELGEAYVHLGQPNEAVEALRQASDLAGARYAPLHAPLDAAAGQSVRH